VRALASTVIMIAMSKRYDIDLVDDIIGHTLMGWWAAFNLFSVVFACYEVSDDPKPISEAVAESTRRRKSSLWAGRPRATAGGADCVNRARPLS
jgi:hypothetical protein